MVNTSLIHALHTTMYFQRFVPFRTRSKIIQLEMKLSSSLYFHDTLFYQFIEVIICTRFGLYSVRTDSAQFLTFELVHSFCLFFDLLASRDEVDQDFVNITVANYAHVFGTNAIYWHKSEHLTTHGTTQTSGHAVWWCGVQSLGHDMMSWWWRHMNGRQKCCLCLNKQD